MDDEEKFTNRHGHTITALQEAVSALPEPDYKTRPEKPVVRRKRSFIRIATVHWRIIGIIALVVVLTPILVGEYVRATYGNNVGDAKTKVAKVLAATQTQQHTTSSTTLNDTAHQLSSIRDALCPGGFLDNLAKLYPRAQQAYDDCAAYRTKVTSLVDTVTDASSQLAYLEALQPLLDGVSKPLEDQFAVLSAQQENWQTFVDGMNKLSVPLSFSTAHAGLLREATVVRDQWIALVQATNSQNTAAFTTARSKLTEGFTAFHAQQTVFSSVVTTSQATLSAAVTALK